jgi:hypothetical protein
MRPISCAVGADNAEDLTVRNSEVQIISGSDARISLGQPGTFNNEGAGRLARDGVRDALAMIL